MAPLEPEVPADQQTVRMTALTVLVGAFAPVVLEGDVHPAEGSVQQIRHGVRRALERGRRLDREVVHLDPPVNELGTPPVAPPMVVGHEGAKLVQGSERRCGIVVDRVLGSRCRTGVEDVTAGSGAALNLEPDVVLTRAEIVGRRVLALGARDQPVAGERLKIA